MVVLITGASDGIGRAAAAKFAQQGHTVYGISRTPADFPFMQHIAADIINYEGLKEAVDRIGPIDLLVACAGTSLASPADLTDMSDARYLYDVNFWGVVYVCSFVLKSMKSQKKGRIILISSMTGLLPIPYLSYYSSSKAAMINYACALAAELKPFHIPVSVMLPGGVRTQFTDKRKKYCQPPDITDDFFSLTEPGLRKSINVLSHEEQTGLSAQQVADQILRLSQKKHPRVIVPVGRIYRLYCLLLRFLPQRLTLWILRQKYAQ